MTTTRPMQLIKNGTTLIVRNGPLLGPSDRLVIVTSPPGPRAPIETPVGVITGEHTAYDQWTDEMAIPGHEAPVVAMAPWKLIYEQDDPDDPRGRIVTVEYPPLDDGRRVFGRSLHLDRDRPLVAMQEGVKGDVLGYMGDTGPADGEHLHQEVLLEHQAGLVAKMLRMGGDPYMVVRASNAHGFMTGTAWVDWLTVGWLAYFNRFEWGEGWPQQDAGLNAGDQNTNAAQLALIRLTAASTSDDAVFGARVRTIIG